MAMIRWSWLGLSCDESCSKLAGWKGENVEFRRRKINLLITWYYRVGQSTCLIWCLLIWGCGHLSILSNHGVSAGNYVKYFFFLFFCLFFLVNEVAVELCVLSQREFRDLHLRSLFEVFWPHVCCMCFLYFTDFCFWYLNFAYFVWVVTKDKFGWMIMVCTILFSSAYTHSDTPPPHSYGL